MNSGSQEPDTRNATEQLPIKGRPGERHSVLPSLNLLLSSEQTCVDATRFCSLLVTNSTDPGSDTEREHRTSRGHFSAGSSGCGSIADAVNRGAAYVINEFRRRSLCVSHRSGQNRRNVDVV